METVSWGELKTKNAVQIQVPACPIDNLRRSQQRIMGKFSMNGFLFSSECMLVTLCKLPVH